VFFFKFSGEEFLILITFLSVF